MLFFNYFCFFVVIFSVQTSLLPLIALAGVAPGLALIFSVYCGIKFEGFRGVGTGFMIGLVQDCLSGGALGINTLSKSLIAYSFFKLKDTIVVDGLIPTGIFLILASFFDGLVYYMASALLLKTAVPSGFLFPTLPIYAAYNALIGPMFFYILNRNRKWVLSKISGRPIRFS